MSALILHVCSLRACFAHRLSADVPASVLSGASSGPQRHPPSPMWFCKYTITCTMRVHHMCDIVFRYSTLSVAVCSADNCIHLHAIRL